MTAPDPTWVEAGAAALCEYDVTPCDLHLEDAEAVIAAVEPLIRADEQNKRDLFWINAILTNDVMVCRIAEGAKEAQ